MTRCCAMRGERITPMYNTQLALSQTRKGKCQGDTPFPVSINILDLLNEANPQRNSTNYPRHFRTKDLSRASRDKLSVRSRGEGAWFERDTTLHLKTCQNVLSWNINGILKRAAWACLCKSSNIHTPAHNNLFNRLRSVVALNQAVTHLKNHHPEGLRGSEKASYKSHLSDWYQSSFLTKEPLSVTVGERMRGQAVLNRGKEGTASTAAQVVQAGLLSQVYKTIIKEKNFGFSTISKYLFQF